jgi:hypothetical protein
MRLNVPKSVLADELALQSFGMLAAWLPICMTI